MINEQSSLQPCARCGRALVVPNGVTNALCETCAVSQNQPWNPEGFEVSGGAFQPTQLSPFPSMPGYDVGQPQVIDPDNPPWGVLGGFGVWFGSVAALIVIPSIIVVAWYFVAVARGQQIGANADEIAKWAMTPEIILVQIVSTMVAHLFTVGLCWAVATKFGKRPFGEAIGWRWEGMQTLVKAGVIIGVSVLAVLVVGTLPRLIPNSKTTPFEEMLKASQAVRIAVAFLAVFTAPLVEELVYRGMLYSPLKRAMGMGGAIATATLLFALVHVPQYWGAWGSLTGLMILSFALTVIRARTRSIFPCVAIHTLFNLVGAISILATGSDVS